MDDGPRISDEAIARDLVNRIQAGDPQAEAALFQRYRRGLLYTLSRMTADHALCEDLQQECLRLVIEKIRNGEVRKPESLNGFIRNIAKNLFIADYRKKSRRGENEDWECAPEPVDARADPHVQAARVQEAALVRVLLGELKHQRDRQLLIRFYVGQQEKEQICRDLDLDPKIFNRILHRARQRFKELWLRKANRRLDHFWVVFWAYGLYVCNHGSETEKREK